MTGAGDDGVPWSVLRHRLDDADETPWPEWLPPKGPGLVAALGYQAVAADHLGPTPCMSLRVGDIVNLSITEDFSQITYVTVAGLRSYRGERVITFDYGTVPHDGWPDEARVPMMRLFTSVYRPIKP